MQSARDSPDLNMTAKRWYRRREVHSESVPSDDGAVWWREWQNHAVIITAVVARTVAESDLRPDALQEVWIQLWRQRHTFRREARPTTWAYRIARRRALNVVRNERAQQHRGALAAVHWWSPTVTPQTPDPFFMDAFSGACRRLPRGQREVFLRFALLGQSYAQIAHAQQVTVGTTRSQMNKARAKLKRWLADYAPG